MSAVTNQTILRVDSSARYENSQSRALVDALIAKLDAAGAVGQVITRDLAQGVAFVDEDWIGANFTPEDDRTDAQRARLAGSDALIAELEAADIVVIGAPIYNFGVPAALKAWVDQVARARKTFRYTENGPVGLLTGKKAYVVVASGGVPVDSPVDFATPYLRHALGFIGIHDVTVIAADQLNKSADEKLADATARIEALAAGA